jgi:hypothetical protein
VGFYVDREALLKLQTATVAIRASLWLCGRPVPLGLLEDVTFTISTIDSDATNTSKKVPNFRYSSLCFILFCVTFKSIDRLEEDKETTFDFFVPENVRSLTFEVAGRVSTSRRGPDQFVSLSKSETFQLNDIDSGPLMEDLHLSFSNQGYKMHVRGNHFLLFFFLKCF